MLVSGKYNICLRCPQTYTNEQMNGQTNKWVIVLHSISGL